MASIVNRTLSPPPLHRHNFGVFLLHEIAHVGVSKLIGLKLFSGEIIFRRIPTYVIMVPKRHGPTDRQTTCMASHSKN